MFCTKCGARIRATAECCGHCGLQRFHVSDAEAPTTISHATLDAVNSGPRLDPSAPNTDLTESVLSVFYDGQSASPTQTGSPGQVVHGPADSTQSSAPMSPTINPGRDTPVSKFRSRAQHPKLTVSGDFFRQ